MKNAGSFHSFVLTFTNFTRPGRSRWHSHGIFQRYGDGSKPWYLLFTQNSWDLWMFIPLKMVSIGIDPYPYAKRSASGKSSAINESAAGFVAAWRSGARSSGAVEKRWLKPSHNIQLALEKQLNMWLFNIPISYSYGHLLVITCYNWLWIGLYTPIP